MKKGGRKNYKRAQENFGRMMNMLIFLTVVKTAWVYLCKKLIKFVYFNLYSY